MNNIFVSRNVGHREQYPSELVKLGEGAGSPLTGTPPSGLAPGEPYNGTL